jgi:hypothetical protein
VLDFSESSVDYIQKQMQQSLIFQIGKSRLSIIIFGFPEIFLGVLYKEPWLMSQQVSS